MLCALRHVVCVHSPLQVKLDAHIHTQTNNAKCGSLPAGVTPGGRTPGGRAAGSKRRRQVAHRSISTSHCASQSGSLLSTMLTPSRARSDLSCESDGGMHILCACVHRECYRRPHPPQLSHPPPALPRPSPLHPPPLLPHPPRLTHTPT